MISAADREKAVELIDEAVSNGASCKKACERLGLTERTYYRWKRRKTKTDSYEEGLVRYHTVPCLHIQAGYRYQ